MMCSYVYTFFCTRDCSVCIAILYDSVIMWVWRGRDRSYNNSQSRIYQYSNVCEIGQLKGKPHTHVGSLSIWYQYSLHSSFQCVHGEVKHCEHAVTTHLVGLRDGHDCGALFIQHSPPELGGRGVCGAVCNQQHTALPVALYRAPDTKSVWKKREEHGSAIGSL